jgi:glycosyltransferase involved in cell wall biosynthesis
LVEREHVRASKVRVCYNGIDAEFFQRRAVEPHPLTVGVVCGLRPEKDLKTLIRAFAPLRKTNAGIRLLIVGGGSELAILQQYAREAGAADAVRFKPATAQVPDWLSQMDIFVLPSVSEAFSNSLMEAMACACCCVASNVGGNPELVSEGETGRLFPAGDAPALTRILHELMESPNDRQRLAANAAARIRERFSNAEAARRMGEIYNGLL